MPNEFTHVAGRRMIVGATWMDSEDRAYNVRLSESPRRAFVRCSDGKLRTFRLGVADSYYSIPARGQIKGRTVHGFVMVSKREDTDEQELVFVPNQLP